MNFLKKFCIAALLCVPAFVFADNQAVLDQIEKANASVKTLVTPFTQVKTVVATGAKKNSAGTLYYRANNCMAQHYTQPSGECFVINANKIYMVRNGKKMHFDASKNAPMRALSNTLLYCIQGKIRTLSAENNAEISVSSDAKHNIVTLTAKKKVARGYKKIVLRYNKVDGRLHSMQMDEFTGNSTLYTMTDYKLNGTIDASVFAIPAK